MDLNERAQTVLSLRVGEDIKTVIRDLLAVNDLLERRLKGSEQLRTALVASLHKSEIGMGKILEARDDEDKGRFSFSAIQLLWICFSF